MLTSKTNDLISFADLKTVIVTRFVYLQSQKQKEATDLRPVTVL